MSLIFNLIAILQDVLNQKLIRPTSNLFNLASCFLSPLSCDTALSKYKSIFFSKRKHAVDVVVVSTALELDLRLQYA